MSSRMKFVVVSTTIDRTGRANRLAAQIVDARLAACVQVTPVKSVYRWKGKVEKAREHLLMCKTRAPLADKLVSFIREHHSYELPEVVVLPIQGGLEDYLSWIAAETGKQHP